MNKKELDFILKKGEGQLVEFKESINKNLAKEIVAFSNSNGGKIYLGVNDNGIVKGINITNNLKSQIQDIASKLDPSVVLKLQEFENILIIDVEEGKNKPYSCSEGFFIRIGANSQKLSRDEILQFAITEGKISFDEQINNDFIYPSDFDESKLDIYLKKSNLEKNLDVQTILLNLGVAKKIDNKLKFNNCGVLFFAKQPSKFFLTSKVVCAEYLDNEKVKILDRKIYDYGILENISQSINFIEKRIKNEFIIKSLERKEILQFPKEAFREAVVNAIMHRDYFDKTSDIMIEVYKNKLIIFNPGGLVSWLKPEEFGKISKTRNSLIASLLSRTIYSEKMGTGIKRIRDAMKKQGLQKPKFEFYEHSFYIELYDSKEGVNEPLNDPLNEPLNEPLKKELILNYINKNPGHNRINIVENTKIPLGTVKRYVKELINEGKIERQGSDKTGGYFAK